MTKNAKMRRSKDTINATQESSSTVMAWLAALLLVSAIVHALNGDSNPVTVNGVDFGVDQEPLVGQEQDEMPSGGEVLVWAQRCGESDG
ncbi:hypothetical protein LTR08_005095 [Meristemomyces frigidus]|nr:hypothetical protein LTR08_005095 [Meristemomyces frigidus]